MLETSKYKDIFNFTKYDRWIARQILTPIKELISLLEKTKKILTKSIEALEVQSRKKIGDNFWGSSGTQAMQAQKTRLEMQMQQTETLLNTLRSYQQKLQ